MNKKRNNTQRYLNWLKRKKERASIEDAEKKKSSKILNKQVDKVAAELIELKNIIKKGNFNETWLKEKQITNTCKGLIFFIEKIRSNPNKSSIPTKKYLEILNEIAAKKKLLEKYLPK